MLSRRVCLRSTAANALNVLRQQGYACSWAGALAGDPAGRQIAAELEQKGIDIRWAEFHPGERPPLSQILHIRSSGSCTIIHYRELPEFSVEAFARKDPARFDRLHFEARNVPACAERLRRTRRAGYGKRISLEVEKPGEGVEAPFPLAAVLLFSRALARLWTSAAACLLAH